MSYIEFGQLVQTQIELASVGKEGQPRNNTTNASASGFLIPATTEYISTVWNNAAASVAKVTETIITAAVASTSPPSSSSGNGTATDSASALAHSKPDALIEKRVTAKTLPTVSVNEVAASSSNNNSSATSASATSSSVTSPEVYDVPSALSPSAPPPTIAGKSNADFDFPSACLGFGLISALL